MSLQGPSYWIKFVVEIDRNLMGPSWSPENIPIDVLVKRLSEVFVPMHDVFPASSYPRPSHVTKCSVIGEGSTGKDYVVHFPLCTS